MPVLLLARHIGSYHAVCIESVLHLAKGKVPCTRKCLWHGRFMAASSQRLSTNKVTRALLAHSLLHILHMYLQEYYRKPLFVDQHSAYRVSKTAVDWMHIQITY